MAGRNPTNLRSCDIELIMKTIDIPDSGIAMHHYRFPETRRYTKKYL